MSSPFQRVKKGWGGEDVASESLFQFLFFFVVFLFSNFEINIFIKMSTGIKNICHNFHNSSLLSLFLICTKIVYIQVTFLFSKKKKNLVVVIIIILFFFLKKNLLSVFFSLNCFFLFV